MTPTSIARTECIGLRRLPLVGCSNIRKLKQSKALFRRAVVDGRLPEVKYDPHEYRADRVHRIAKASLGWMFQHSEAQTIKGTLSARGRRWEASRGEI